MFENPRNRLSLRQGRSRWQLVGAICWCLCLQFFVAEQFVQQGWTTPYSWTGNYISDLGAIHCANRPVNSDRFVCSPRHTVMNGSFFLQGLLIAGGALLTENAFSKTRLQNVGRGMIALSGAGVLVVGLAPEDITPLFHFGGAVVHFLAGNIGMILFGAAIPRAHCFLKTFALLSGSVGLIGLLLLACGGSGALGMGGMERVAAYPLPLCLAVLGAHRYSIYASVSGASASLANTGAAISADDNNV